MIFPLYQDAVADEMTSGTAVSVATTGTELLHGETSADLTLADGSKIGQIKKLVAGDAYVYTITPSNFVDGTTVALAAVVGNFVELMWAPGTGSAADAWRVVASQGVTIA